MHGTPDSWSTVDPRPDVTPVDAPISLPPDIEEIVDHGTDEDPDLDGAIDAPLEPVPVVPDNFAIGATAGPA